MINESSHSTLFQDYAVAIDSLEYYIYKLEDDITYTILVLEST